MFVVPGERQAVLAPPETEWYHGRLDRYTSEERLWAAGKLGSYLGEHFSFVLNSIVLNN